MKKYCVGAEIQYVDNVVDTIYIKVTGDVSLWLEEVKDVFGNGMNSNPNSMSFVDVYDNFHIVMVNKILKIRFWLDEIDIND